MSIPKRQRGLWMVALAATVTVLVAQYWEPVALLYHQWAMDGGRGDRTRGEHERRLLQQPLKAVSYAAAPFASVLFDIVRQQPPDARLVFQIHEEALASAPVTIQLPARTDLEKALAKLCRLAKCTYRTAVIPGDVFLLTIEMERPGARERVGVIENSSWPSRECVVVEESHIHRAKCTICSPTEHRIVPQQPQESK